MTTSPLRRHEPERRRFDGIVVGYGPTREAALADARAVAGAPVELLAATEVAGSWSVLARRV